MKTLKLAIVGLGQRGSSMLQTFLGYSAVDVVAICDVYEDRIEAANKVIQEKRGHLAKGYADFMEMFSNKEIEAFYIASSWEEHVNQAIECIKHGIPVGMEVGGAYTIDDCWRIVDAYEEFKTPIMLLENCCFDRFETLVTGLAREGKFGEIVYCHGAYSHDLRDEITGGNLNRHYRLRNYLTRNCENYPTHELGPIAKILGINHGNRLVSIFANASKSAGLEDYIRRGKCKDESLKDAKFQQADVVASAIRCENGELITMELDTTLPGFYSRQLKIKGTHGSAYQESNMILLDGDAHEEIWNPCENLKKNGNNASQYDEYLPKYWREITEEKIRLGHGGMDFYMVGAFIDCVINHKPMPIDVYDIASWYAITPLSELSIKEGREIPIPDFTRGKYKTSANVEAFEKEATYEEYL